MGEPVNHCEHCKKKDCGSPSDYPNCCSEHHKRRRVKAYKRRKPGYTYKTVEVTGHLRYKRNEK